MRILFMGTPDIASVMLCELAKYHTICGVFCQPDKPVGRKATVTPPAVKITAQRLGFDVYQPVKMRDGETEKLVRSLNPDLIAVVAYGRILPKEILEIPKFGCVNIHASLLPKYRGAAPIQYAILMGDEKTGVSAMYMDEGLDTGDVIEMAELEIHEDDNSISLFEKLGDLGARLLCKTASDIESGIINRTKQSDFGISYAPPFTKESGAFSWNDEAVDIFNKARALCVWPNAYFLYRKKKIKLMKAKKSILSGNCGEVLSVDPFVVGAKNGAVELLELKPEGSRQMSGKDWTLGTRIKIGDILTEV